MAESGLRAAVRADADANAGHPLGRLSLLVEILSSRGVQTLLLYRLAVAARTARLPLAPLLLTRVAQILYGADLDPHATIAPGVTLRHPVGIVVGGEAVIETGVCLFSGVTLGKRLSGGRDGVDGMPTIRAGVLLATGAKVLGPVEIGAGAIVGANAVVLTDVPAGSVATAPPAVVRPARGPQSEGAPG